MKIVTANLEQDNEVVHLSWDDQTSARFHALWLRDNAQDEHTRSASNGQRLITLADIDPAIRIKDVAIEQGQLAISFEPCDTSSVFSPQWLREHSYDRDHERSKGRLPNSCELFDSNLSLDAVTGDFEELIQDQQALLIWLSQLARFGFARLHNGPTENGALLRVAELIGYIRETNYGKWFEVKSMPSPDNLAYTSLGLQAHTDNPYRDPVPTLQLLYCLENSATGGESQVIDGFNAAARLRDLNPHYFHLLSSHCARFEYLGQESTILQSTMPMIELRADGELRCIRFNNRSTGAITDVPFEDMADYYSAYRAFAKIISDPALELSFKLDPGECFVVDNTRVMHARSAFELGASEPDASEGGAKAVGRWLQGCYIERDGLFSEIAVLEKKLQKNS